MNLKERLNFGWFIDTETPSTGKAAAYSRWSRKPKTYEQHLEHQIYCLVLQEGATPAGFAKECMDPSHERWQEAWDLWDEWVEAAWKDAAMAHAGRPLSDEEYLEMYGPWKDRNTLPGKKLNDLVEPRRRPWYGWLN